MTNIFELLEHELNDLRNLDLSHLDEVLELLDLYKAQDSEVENIMSQIDTWDHKAQRAYEKMKKLNEDSIEYKESKNKFEKYVGIKNRLESSKNTLLREMFEIRKKVEDLSKEWDLILLDD